MGDGSDLRAGREARFVQSLGAFLRRDFATIEGVMRRDVVMDVPGSSWLAGRHVGMEEVSRCILGLRQVLTAEDRRISFRHEGDVMTARLHIEVHGPQHEVEMTLQARVRYDRDGLAEAVSIMPDDLGLFDHVINTLFQGQPSV
jgi:hypothetical protein